MIGAWRDLLSTGCLLALAVAARAQAPPFDWAHTVPGGDDDGGYGLAVDAAGNCYLTTYLGTNATIGNVQLAGAGILIAAYDGRGNFLRAFKGSSSGGFSQGLAVDADGNVFVAGWFGGTTSFGQTQLVNSLPYGGKAFLAKYTSSGSVFWARNILASQEDETEERGAASAVTVDIHGNAYVTGTSGYGFDGRTFMAKYDAQGNKQWMRFVLGTNHGSSIVVDKDTNCIVGGSLQYSASFGNVTVRSRGQYGAFVAKYGSGGAVLWARAEGGDYIWNKVYAVAVDQHGNIYATGYYSGPGAFGSTDAPAGADMFVAKYDPAGQRLWVRTGGGLFNDIGHAIAVDAAGNCYVAGIFQGAAALGPFAFANAGGDNLEEAFVAKLDTNGEWLWAKQAGGARDDYGYALAMNQNGTCFLGGYFTGNAKFDQHTLISNSEIGESFVAAIAPQQPKLAIVRNGEYLELSWPSWASHCRLEAGNAPGRWAPVSVASQIAGNRVRANVTAKGAGRFFRLIAP